MNPDILAIYYHNIGPFVNQHILLHLQSGKYMIQAPVGSGKSFLFFDGIIYGLYKYSTRDILSTTANSGSIWTIIYSLDSYRLITRNITRNTSKGDKLSSISIKSTLHRLKDIYISDIDQIHSQDILTKGLNPQDLIQLSHRDPIDAKNETDIQNTIEQILPPRIVMQNRNILMQSSDDIFELGQTDRIQIMKNIFGLENIDQAKQILADQKNYLKALATNKSDTSKYQQNFSDTLVKISQISLSYKLNIAILTDSIDISRLDIDSLDPQIDLSPDTTYIDQLQTRSDQYTTLQAQISQSQLDIQDIQANINQQDHQILNIQKQIDQISHINIEDMQYKLSELKNQKNNYISQKENLEKNKNIIDTYHQIQNIKNQGLSLRNEILEIQANLQNDNAQKEKIEQQLIDLNQNYNSQITKLKEISIQNIQKQKQQLQKQLDIYISQKSQITQDISSLSSQLHLQQSKIDSAHKFFCNKIEAECPFVNQIQHRVTDTSEQSIDIITQDISRKKSQITELDQNISHIYTQISQLTNTDISETYIDTSDIDQQYQNQKTNLKSQLQHLENRQNQSDYKNMLDKLISQKDQLAQKYKELGGDSIEIIYKQIININDQISILDKQIYEYEDQISKSQNQIDQKKQLEQDLYISQTQISTLKSQISQKNEYITNLKSQIANIDIDDIKTQLSQRQDLQIYISKTLDIYQNYKQNSLEIKKLQEQQKIYTDLYDIFHKELMLIVLERYMPTLEDMINELLSRIADYRIKFQVIGSGEKLEIRVYRGKEIREVKSLSGGQRAILRLCWILSIASWSGNKFLLLDETINNLDTDMISLVSELLEDFLTRYDMKFYSITHSPQIQAMNIWDSIIKI